MMEQTLPPAATANHRLSLSAALTEANRCLMCWDAPCTRACPTSIDVPGFIKRIANRDDLGAARVILGANVLGDSCAHACPTTVLCEGACVDNTLMKAPVQIGRLQRYACDRARGEAIRRPSRHDCTPSTVKRTPLVIPRSRRA